MGISEAFHSLDSDAVCVFAESFRASGMGFDLF